MFKINIDNFEKICYQLESKNYSLELKNLLKNSLFYYCSGKDVTPISAFKEDYPIFLYADKLRNNSSIFNEEMTVLYQRIKKEKIELKCVHKLKLDENFINTEISLWQTSNGNFFILLFIQGDALNTYKSIYENECLSILPKCISNIKYEMNNSYFLYIEKQVQYILGHCHDKNFIVVDSYDYKGDYTFINKVPLYCKQ